MWPHNMALHKTSPPLEEGCIMGSVSPRKDHRLRHTVMARWVRHDLHMLRMACGFSLQKAAAKSGLNYRTIARMETGADPVSIATISLLCDAYGAPAEQREQLKEMNQAARSVGWWDAWRDVPLGSAYAEHIELEELADKIIFYSPTLFAGFVQCPEYAEFVQASDWRPDIASGRKAGRLVELRMERQHRLLRRGVAIRILLDPGAFSRAPTPVVDAQIDHMRKLSADGSVEFRMVRGVAPLTLHGTLSVFEAFGRSTLCFSSGTEFHVEAAESPDVVDYMQVGFDGEWKSALAISDSDWKDLR